MLPQYLYLPNFLITQIKHQTENGIFFFLYLYKCEFGMKISTYACATPSSAAAGSDTCQGFMAKHTLKHSNSSVKIRQFLFVIYFTLFFIVARRFSQLFGIHYGNSGFENWSVTSASEKHGPSPSLRLLISQVFQQFPISISLLFLSFFFFCGFKRSLYTSTKAKLSFHFKQKTDFSFLKQTLTIHPIHTQNKAPEEEKQNSFSSIKVLISEC